MFFDKLNKRPRKCLGWKAPFEVFYSISLDKRHQCSVKCRLVCGWILKPTASRLICRTECLHLIVKPIKIFFIDNIIDCN